MSAGAGTNITDAHRAAFAVLRDGAAGSMALFSCFVNGHPTAAIVAVTRGGESGESDVVFARSS